MVKEGATIAEMRKASGTNWKQIRKFLDEEGIDKKFPTYLEGEKHYAWKGRLIDKDGYVLIHRKGHPNARKHTHYILEHRLVMEAAIGRLLLPEEVVHHRNGVKHDNRIENLQLFESNGEHLAVDLAGRCPNWSEDGWVRIQEGVRLEALRKQNASRIRKEQRDAQCIQMNDHRPS